MNAAEAVVAAGGLAGLFGFGGAWLSGHYAAAAARSQGEKTLEAAKEQAKATVLAVQTQIGDAASARDVQREDDQAKRDQARSEEKLSAREQAEDDFVAFVRDTLLWSSLEDIEASMRRESESSVAGLPSRDLVREEARRRIGELWKALLRVQTSSSARVARLALEIVGGTQSILVVVYAAATQFQPLDAPSTNDVFSKVNDLLWAVRQERGLSVEGGTDTPDHSPG
ncbi:hypothetical protein [Allobranchiibius sp. GilTou38]|uniref:hypothetical protein n=1 Tax=Allobranchiibius sp. GilTou38 TaxID=2815210 RepID=UPI001AA128E0|nr:hypothetical protein [Allobranchiibius sp. GilTou38]MBO1765783.1 hypothetical protein [Allobranchiibius sp. GilTou38]